LDTAIPCEPDGWKLLPDCRKLIAVKKSMKQPAASSQQSKHK
jgi:hypothetical protein